jgi:hypothetical protein
MNELLEGRPIYSSREDARFDDFVSTREEQRGIPDKFLGRGTEPVRAVV